MKGGCVGGPCRGMGGGEARSAPWYVITRLKELCAQITGARHSQNPLFCNNINCWRKQGSKLRESTGILKNTLCIVYLFFYKMAGYIDSLLDGDAHRVNCTSMSDKQNLYWQFGNFKRRQTFSRGILVHYAQKCVYIVVHNNSGRLYEYLIKTYNT